MKYGLMKYSYTTNLGNEIQSIAARRFLPQIDYYIEHEKLNLFQNQEKVKMIMNGWYLDCLKSWPPSDSIDPLLISMHFTTSANDTKTVISSPESRDFLSTYGPVGCRDYATLELLKEIDIDAYYSGCLTLTLESKKTKTEKDYIVVNSYNSEEIIDFLKSKTDLPIYDFNQEFIYSFDKKYLERMPTSYVLTSFLNYNEKLFVAENILNLYKNACCVLTDRVHAAFPCLALETPVLFFNSAKFAPERFKGISDLVLESTIEGYKNNYDIFDVENPPKNSKKYLKIRKDLINRTKSFTGHISDSYEIWHDSEEIRNYQTYLLTNTARESREYMHNVIHMSRDFESKINIKNDIIENYKKIINENEKTIKKQKNLINEMQNSNSWKLTKPIRNFRSIFTKKRR